MTKYHKNGITSITTKNTHERVTMLIRPLIMIGGLKLFNKTNTKKNI